MDERELTVLSHPSRVKYSDRYSDGAMIGVVAANCTLRTCIDKETSQNYVCKSIIKRPACIEGIKTQLKVLYQMRGVANVARVKEVLEEADTVYIILDCRFCATLLEWVRDEKHKEVKEAGQIIAIVVRVIHNCHSLGIAHGDVNLTGFAFERKDDINSLITIDFSFSVFFTPGEPLPGVREMLCAPFYVAPEIFGGPSYEPQVDMFSAGMLFFNLLDNKYQEKDNEMLLGAKLLVVKMIEIDPFKRLTTQQMMEHPWICENVDATHRKLSSVVILRLRRYSEMNRYEKMGVWMIAWGLREEETGGFLHMFGAMDKETCGKISFETFRAGLKKYDSTLEDSNFESIVIVKDGLIECKEWIAATIPDEELKFDPIFLEEAFLLSKPSKPLNDFDSEAEDDLTVVKFEIY